MEAFVTRYKDRVKELEIWNEPDHPGQNITLGKTAKLNIRTTEIIKRIQPEAKIAGLAYTSNSDKVYLVEFLKIIANAGKRDLLDWISYHSNTMQPEDAYTENSVFGLRWVVEKYSAATGREWYPFNLYTAVCFVGILLNRIHTGKILRLFKNG